MQRLRAGGILLLWLLATGSHAEPLVLVAHPASPLQQVQLEEVAALYLDQRKGVDGLSQVTPLDLDSRQARSQFYETVTNRSLTQLRAYWSKRVFTGKGRPPKAYSAAEVVSLLKADPTAIGYVPKSQVNGLKPLLELAE